MSLGECYKNNPPPRNSKPGEIKIKPKFFDAVGKSQSARSSNKIFIACDCLIKTADVSENLVYARSGKQEFGSEAAVNYRND